MTSPNLRKLAESMIEVLSVAASDMQNHEHSDPVLHRVEFNLNYMARTAQEELDND